MDDKKIIASQNTSVPGPIEDITQYGEFVPSTFAWMTPDSQRKRAEKLEEKLGEKNDDSKTPMN